MNDNGIKLPPLPRLQVPRIEADVSLIDIKALAQWCERIATDYARAAVLAEREALRAERDALLDALRQIADWPDGGGFYDQGSIKRFAQHAIDAMLKAREARND